MRTRTKNNPHRARKVPKYKRATNAQVIAAPEAKDPGTVFGSKLWPRPGGEPENRLVAPKDRYTELHAQSLEGTCNPFVRVRGHVQAMGGLSSSLSEGGEGVNLVWSFSAPRHRRISLRRISLIVLTHPV